MKAKFFLTFSIFFVASLTARALELQQVTPQKISESFLRSGELVVIQFQGKGLRPGVKFFCEGAGGVRKVFEPKVFQDSTSATEFRLAKVVLPSNWESGSWNVRPEFQSLVGATLVNAFEVVSDQISITSISPSEVPGNYNHQTQVRILGSNFQQNLKVFIGRMEVDQGAIEVRPNQVNLKLKFRSGKRLTGGIHKFLIVVPDGSRAEKELKVGLAEKSKPLPRQVAWWKIALRVLLAAGIVVLWGFAFWKWIPRYVAGWTQPAGASANCQTALLWSLRIMASGLAGFFADILGYPFILLLQIFGFTFLFGAFLVSLAAKGRSFRDIFSGKMFKAYPVFWVAFVFWLIYILIFLTWFLNR